MLPTHSNYCMPGLIRSHPKVTAAVEAAQPQPSVAAFGGAVAFAVAFARWWVVACSKCAAKDAVEFFHLGVSDRMLRFGN